MFVLKMRTTTHKKVDEKPMELTDSAVWFVEADRVIASTRIGSPEARDSVYKAWSDSGTPLEDLLGNVFTESADGKTGGVDILPGRLLCATRNEEPSWYLASEAWLLGPTGDTVERLA